MRAESESTLHTHTQQTTTTTTYVGRLDEETSSAGVTKTDRPARARKDFLSNVQHLASRQIRNRASDIRPTRPTCPTPRAGGPNANMAAPRGVAALESEPARLRNRLVALSLAALRSWPVFQEVKHP